MEKKTIISPNDIGTFGYPYVKNKQTKNFDPYLTLHTKFNSNWIIDPNVKPRIIKLIEYNIGENLCDLLLK